MIRLRSALEGENGVKEPGVEISGQAGDEARSKPIRRFKKQNRIDKYPQGTLFERIRINKVPLLNVYPYGLSDASTDMKARSIISGYAEGGTWGVYAAHATGKHVTVSSRFARNGCASDVSRRSGGTVDRPNRRRWRVALNGPSEVLRTGDRPCDGAVAQRPGCPESSVKGRTLRRLS